MSGDLVSGEGPNPASHSRHLQKPFRISDVLRILTEVFSPVHAGKR